MKSVKRLVSSSAHHLMA